MDVRVSTDPEAFERTVFPFLQRDAVLNTIIMSNVHERAGRTAVAESEPSYFVSVHEAGDVIGVAMRTPGRGVYLGPLRADLAEPVADAYAEVLTELPGVAGDRPAAAAFARRWGELRGGQAVESKGTRLHKLGELTRLTAEAGHARLMRADEVELVIAWSSDGFEELRPGIEEWAALQLEQETMWIWAVDGQAVSMVGFHLPIFGVCRVGPVYTPPDHRKHGYAGALTSHVSGEIIAQGNQACLYTDLANPTSNKIYYEAGYRPVADFVDYEFS
jgi:GNAT superfamily N-acetyltransferase